jgi:hypothetical protein
LSAVEIEVASRNTSSELLKQSVILIDCKRKSALLGQLIAKIDGNRCLSSQEQSTVQTN